jgi:hypothetical protein
MKVDYFAHVYEVDAEHVIVGGVPQQVLTDQQIPATWYAPQRGWLCRITSVAALVARLEYANAAVKFHPALEPTP